MDVKIGSVAWTVIKPRPSHVARTAHASGNDNTRASWYAAVMGLTHPSPPWGTLADAGHDPIEYGDRVIDHLVAAGATVNEVLSKAVEVVGDVIAVPKSEDIDQTKDFSEGSAQASASV